MAQATIRDQLETIPHFDGNPVTISNFIIACEDVLTTLARQDDERFNSFLMRHVRSKLVGRAASLISVRHVTTWPDLKALIQTTFGDQRDEDSLLRDLIMTRQGNESAITFGERCQDLRSLLISRVNSTENDEDIRNKKIEMYSRLAVKTFTKGLREPYSLIVRCRNPKTLEEGLTIISEENNLTYQKKELPQPQKPSYFPPTGNSMFPRNIPTPTQVRPNIPAYQPRPMNWPNRPNVWQPQNRSVNQQSWPRPNVTPNQQYKPTPMDTSSGNTRRTVQQSVNQRPPVQQTFFRPQQAPQRPHWVAQELHYQEEYPCTSTQEMYDPLYAYEDYFPPQEQYEYQEILEPEQTPVNFEEPPKLQENTENFQVTGPDKETC